MPTVQLNVRIDETLKCQGDEVLEKANRTASDAVRATWEYMARYDAFPSFEAPETGGPDIMRLQAIRDGAGMARRLMERAGYTIDPTGGPYDYDSLRLDAYQEKYAEVLHGC